MNSEFDPYLQWLGIRDPDRPPNHYRLLGLELFESDPDVIATAADRQMSHVRTFQGGKNSELSQRILNELSAAKLQLLNADTKTSYDKQLRETVPLQSPPQPKQTVSDSPSPKIEIETEIERDPYQLQRPKRGIRGISAKTIGVVSLFVILIFIGLGYLFVWKLGLFSQDDMVAENKKPVVANKKSDSQQDKKDSQTDTKADVNAATPTDKDTNDQTPTEIPPIQTSDKFPDDHQPKPIDIKDESPKTSQAATPPKAPWNAPRTPPQPMRISQTTSPVAGLALALSNRKTSNARVLLNSTLKNSPSLSAEQIDNFKMLLLAHEQFWKSYDQGLAKLEPSSRFVFQGQLVGIVRKTNLDLELQAVNKDRKTFRTVREQVDLQLATAIVEFQNRNQKSVAWRQIGCVQFVDRFGSTAQGVRYLQLAKRNGLSTITLENALRTMLNFVNPKKFSVNESTLQKIVKQHERQKIPGPSTLRAAAKTIVKQEKIALNSRTPKGREDTVSALRELLEKKKENINKAVHFFALDQIRKYSFRNGDLQNSLWAIVQQCEFFECEFKDVFAKTKQIDTKHSLDLDLLTENAIELANKQILNGDIPLAQSILETIHIDVSHSPLQQLRINDALTELQQSSELFDQAESALAIVQANPKDAVANQKIGEFLCFVRQEFKLGMPFLIRGTDAELQDLAMKDLLANPSNRPNTTLATGWQAISEKRSGRIKQSMLQRAFYWTQKEVANET